jgi:hypothetical protein
MELVEAYLARRALDYLVGFTSRRCSGASCRARNRRAACSPSRCGSSSSARWRSRRSAPRILVGARRSRHAARPELRGPARRHGRQEARPLRPPTEAEAGWPSRPSPPARCRSRGGGQARHAQPLAALHDLDAAAGGQPQVRLRRETDHEHGAAALRGRAHHLHADRRDRHGARGRDRAARDAIADRYGAELRPRQPRIYKNKAKNAQEAHECIRPTDMSGAGRAETVGGRPAQALRPDLEAHHRQPDGGRAAGTHHGHRRQPMARWSCARPVRWSCSTGSSRSTRKAATTCRGRRWTSACRRSPRATRWRRCAESRPRQAGRRRRQRHPVTTMAAFWASSISPSRRRATPRRRWSSGWRSSASAGPRPMPRSSTRSRRAATSARTRGRLIPRGQGAAGDGLPRQLFPPLPRIRLHRHAGGRA